MTIANLFTANTATATNTNGTLAGTQQLTTLASSIADKVLAYSESHLEELSQLITDSRTKPAELDKLIEQAVDLGQEDVDFLKDLDEKVTDSMLKSQQSKRSRCKSKEMTLDNYRSMMTAAIAESLIRMATGKEKGTYGGRTSTLTAYDEETLQKLADDQEALRKEIRNIQSKKSIMKSKAGFTEESERWLLLLEAEEQLKSIRDTGSSSPKTIVVDETKDKLTEMLAETDPSKLKPAELKQMLNAIKDMVTVAPEDVPLEEEAEEASFKPEDDIQ